ncbi:MAG: hypothetical protein J6V50_03430 [Clostridia bacterium]|nr:hypothetical protein [Clostridia bacterium]
MDVTVTCTPTLPYGNIGDVTRYEYGTVRKLADSEFFKTSKLSLDGAVELGNANSFISAIILDGELSIKYNKKTENAKKGDSIFIPANLKVELSGCAEIILSSY